MNANQMITGSPCGRAERLRTEIVVRRELGWNAKLHNKLRFISKLLRNRLQDAEFLARLILW
jgi:hypothetical protein